MESKSKKHFMISIFKHICRLGACYGLWLTGDIMLMTVGVFLALAEGLSFLEEIQVVDDMVIHVKIKNKENKGES